MKNVFAIALVLAISAISAAQTSSYSADAVELLTAASQCPTELAELSKAGRIGSATHTVQNDLDIYSIKFVAGGYPPAFQTYPVGTLNITRSFEISPIHAPDAPGGQMIYSCKMTK